MPERRTSLPKKNPTHSDVPAIAGTLSDLVDLFDKITFHGATGSVTVNFDRNAPTMKRLRILAALTGRKL